MLSMVYPWHPRMHALNVNGLPSRHCTAGAAPFHCNNCTHNSIIALKLRRAPCRPILTNHWTVNIAHFWLTITHDIVHVLWSHTHTLLWGQYISHESVGKQILALFSMQWQSWCEWVSQLGHNSLRGTCEVPDSASMITWSCGKVVTITGIGAASDTCHVPTEDDWVRAKSYRRLWYR